MRWGTAHSSAPASDAVVLRYDGQGKLIEAQTSGLDSRSETGVERIEVASFAPDDSGTIAARAAEAVPKIRQIAGRYADNPTLTALGLSPLQWAVFFQAMIRVESGYNPAAASPAGARGLAQLMPETAKSLGVDIDDPVQNLDGGARYLLAQMASFGSLKLALAAYNAGPDAVRAYHGMPPFTETQNHIVRVMAEYNRLLGTY